jgi:hypothetical protein
MIATVADDGHPIAAGNGTDCRAPRHDRSDRSRVDANIAKN